MAIRFKNLVHGDEVITQTDPQVMEFYIFQNEYYLTNGITMWNLQQFNEENFEMYYGDKRVGEYDYSYLLKKTMI